MGTVVDVFFLIAGLVTVVLAPWTAEQRASNHFSAAQLKATDARTMRRVKRFKVIAVVANVVVGGVIAAMCGFYLVRYLVR